MSNVKIRMAVKKAFDKLITSCYNAMHTKFSHEFTYNGIEFDLRMNDTLDVCLYRTDSNVMLVIHDEDQLMATIEYPNLYF